MTIELRLTDVDPPAAELSRTIYRDIVNLPDPTTLGITIRYFNYDNVGLYMQITGSKTGYAFGTVNLGLLASGANAYQNLDNFASRAKPTVAQLPNGEMSENITLTLKGYTDAGYSTLKWTYDRVVTVIWINSSDAAFTVNNLDNFDDGTVDGWSVAHIAESDTGSSASVSDNVNTDYVLSPPYSCKLTDLSIGWPGIGGYSNKWFEDELYKSFTTPNKSEVYAIIDIRLGGTASSYFFGAYSKRIKVLNGTTPLVILGKPPDATNTEYCPTNRWIRIVVPLPANTTLTLKVRAAIDVYFSPYLNTFSTFIWIDDFKIISK